MKNHKKVYSYSSAIALVKKLRKLGRKVTFGSSSTGSSNETKYYVYYSGRKI